MEPRCLLAATFTEFPIATANASPYGITVGPDGNLWFAEEFGKKIGMINPTTHAITDFLISQYASPMGITAGPDGNLWFTDGADIGAINPKTHAIAEFSVPNILSEIFEITAGPDGNLWFTENYPNNIGMINPKTHAITEFPVPTPGGSPDGITLGPDGNLWFTEELAGKIGMINPTTHAITEFTIPTYASAPHGITVGPDGNLWFAENVGKIGMINPTTHVITDFQLPTADGEPAGITAGPGGNVWFTEQEAGHSQIGMINPTTHAITEYLTPTDHCRPNGITFGPDGNLWFTETGGNQIAQARYSPDLTAATTTTTLSSSANPSLVGQPVTFTATVTPGAGGGALTGSVTFTIDGKAQTPVPLKLTNGGERATLQISTLSAGNHTVTATYSGDAADSTSSLVTPLVQTVLSAAVSAPMVTHVEWIGLHMHPKFLVLTFSTALDPVSATDRNNYVLVNPSGRRIKFKSVIYDSSAHTVTLRTRQLINLHRNYRLTVDGADARGVRGAGHVLLDGAGDGQPGTDFVTTLNWKELVLPPRSR
jgi:streptogramin lyase